MYFLIPKRAKQLWLLVASYYFYMSWNVQYGCLILLVTAIGYGGGLLLAQNKVRQGKRRLAVPATTLGAGGTEENNHSLSERWTSFFSNILLLQCRISTNCSVRWEACER